MKYSCSISGDNVKSDYELKMLQALLASVIFHFQLEKFQGESVDKRTISNMYQVEEILCFCCDVPEECRK